MGAAWLLPGANGVLGLLESIRVNDASTRFYQASTSELYRKAVEVPQTESTPFHPRSSYAVAKLYGEIVIDVDPSSCRPAEVDLLHGGPAKARERLG